MPIGMVVMHWDERVGVEVLGQYPDEIQIQERTLLQLYSQHEFTGEAGMVTLMAGATNLASYYTGPDSALYVIMVLNIDEDGDSFGEGLAEMAQQIAANSDPDVIRPILPSLFQRLSIYPTLNQEQRLAMEFGNDVKRMIIKRLRQDAMLPKSEIIIWLRDEYRDHFVDTENIMASLIKNSILKVSSVKGMSSDMIFLNRDLMLLRIPPVELVKDPVGHHLPAGLRDSYIQEVRNYFENYVPSEKDILEVIENVVLEPQSYEVLKLMREALVTRNDLEKLKKKGVDDLNDVLKRMWDAKMISVFKDDNGQEYYCLVTDFYLELYYPHYLLNTIRNQYRQKSQNNNVLLRALDMMKDEYGAMLKEKNAAKQAK